MKFASGAVALGCLVSLSACGISAETIQTDIKTKMASHGVTMTKVECPKPKGPAIVCKGTDDNGTEGIFDVTVKGSAAEWKLKGSFVDLQKATEALRNDAKNSKPSATVEVNCPTKSLLITAGLTMTCDVRVGGTAMKSRLVFTDATGSLTFERPWALAPAVAPAAEPAPAAHE